MTRMLVIVDVQQDFCEGGALAVPQASAIVPILNRYGERFAAAHLPVVATRDWHPSGSRHFREHGGRWPPHAIQGTTGAAFHPQLRLPPGAAIISKGVGEDDEGYSAFSGTTEHGASLGDLLHARQVRHIYVGGLATDYCVKATTLDALDAGIPTTLLIDACRGVNAQPGDVEDAIAAMVRAGATLTTIEHLADLAAD